MIVRVRDVVRQFIQVVVGVQHVARHVHRILAIVQHTVQIAM